MQTLYAELPDTLYAKLRNIRLIAFDVDGIFSDGRIYLGNAGEELKAFHTLDGYGVKSLDNIGVAVAVITGRQSHIVTARMQALGVAHIVQGSEDKATALAALIDELGLRSEQVASMGDDMPDLGMFAHSEVAISVPNGHPLVKQAAHWITEQRGGFGAVREVTDTLLQAHDKLTAIHGASI
jgi:3-deoxy-D-manno-octulosonate 8-phosphate phosphatase (KDO 8-P phosphatase)